MLTTVQQEALIRQVETLQSDNKRLRNQLDAATRHTRRVMDTVELERRRADGAEARLKAAGLAS